MKKKSQYSGFTLVELMVTVSIASILVTLAVPSLKSMVDRNRVDTITSELVTALFFVRSEALKRRMDVILCVQNAAGTACEPQATGKTYDYANGWIIYMDCNDNGTYDAGTLKCDIDNNGTNETTELLHVHEKLNTNMTVTGNSNYTAEIGFSMNGRIKGIGGSLTVDLLSVNDNNVDAKKIVVSNSGRIRTEIIP